MKIQTSLSLAPFTTFHIGGPAEVLIEAHTEEDIRTALAYAREGGLSLSVLGGGSNVLVPDRGVDGVVLHMMLRGVSFEDRGVDELLIAGAGTLWEEVVDAAIERELFGIENLAGIPGTIGGAAVQNIGAYGAELGAVFAYADVIDSATGESRRVRQSEAAFGYRSSLFKKHRELIVVRIALRLAKQAALNTAYADIGERTASGTLLRTPRDVADAVRAIRAAKFPHGSGEGTAGSFFKNPIVSREQASDLSARFRGLPDFPQENGGVKLSLAWILDHALSLKGYTNGRVRLYEKQPLVMVATDGATAAEVEALALDVSLRVHAAFGITIEREVETVGAR